MERKAMRDESSTDGKYVSEDEMETLILALIHGNGGCMDLSEIERQTSHVLDWVIDARITSQIVNDVLAGGVGILVDDKGEIKFRAQTLPSKENHDD
jgi:hypothetical protein